MNIDKLEPWKSETVFKGQKYGRLTVIATYRQPKTYKYYALCECECGTHSFLTRSDKLRNGLTTGCGCVQREAATTHGCWGHPIFHIWNGMMSRCYNKDDKRYPHYGERGISVCEHWKDVRIFIRDMEAGYKPGLQLDRQDNNGNYCPENCRWVTQAEQARNKSSNIKLSFNGQNLCLGEWSHITNIPYGTLWERVKILGWPAERALTTPSMDADSRCKLARSGRVKKS